MATSELQVTLPCTCGRSPVARAKDAGGSINCACGNSVAVPKLSELRLLAGADAFITNPAEAIRKAQLAGTEPAGDRCLVCGSADTMFFQCHAVCEQSHAKKTSSYKSFEIFRWLILPLIANIILAFKKEDETIDRQGHDIDVAFRLPVCRLCASTIGNPARTSIAKELIQRVPLLKQLLDYYPALSLSVNRL
jgi:hypothetical protein